MSSSSSSDEDVKASGIENVNKSGLARRHGHEATAPAPPTSKKSERKPKSRATGSTMPVSLPNFVTDPSNPIGWAVTGTQEFAADSIRLVRRCTKPDAREFKKIAYACAIGFLLMGFIGFIVKLVFIPVNNIIVGG